MNETRESERRRAKIEKKEKKLATSSVNRNIKTESNIIDKVSISDSSFETIMVSRREMMSDGTTETNSKEDSTNNNMKAMKTSKKEENGTINRISDSERSFKIFHSLKCSEENSKKES